MSDFTSLERIQDANVYDSDGDKIGSVGQVYLDDQTDRPTFITVKTGMFGGKESFIPVEQATSTDDGLRVPFTKDYVKDAPNVDADGSITPQEEQRIYEYYNLQYAGAETRVTGGTDGRVSADVNRNDDDSVVVRNEELNVHTEQRATGQVRLRKHTYTDTETVEVPVTREEVVVEREPVDPNSAEARTAGDGDEEVVVSTYEEVPVVDKTVSAEKVSVDKTTVQDTEAVSGTVRHEDVEVDREAGRKGRRDA